MRSDNLYSRQQNLPLSIPQGVIVVGCGGTGSWVAIEFAMIGVRNIVLFDPDKLEESNRARLPFCAGRVGDDKVAVVRDYIQEIRPECNVIAIVEKATPEVLEELNRNLLPSLGATTLIDCTDNFKTQRSLYKHCVLKGYFYRRCGYDIPDGSFGHITISARIPEWGDLEDEETGYSNAPSFVVPASLAANMLVYNICCNGQEVSIDLKEIGIPILKK